MIGGSIVRWRRLPCTSQGGHGSGKAEPDPYLRVLLGTTNCSSQEENDVRGKREGWKKSFPFEERYLKACDWSRSQEAMTSSVYLPGLCLVEEAGSDDVICLLSGPVIA